MAVRRKAPRLATSTAMADCFIRAARAVASLQDLALLMEAVTADLGFRHYALIHHADLRGSPPDRVNIKRYPDDIAARIIDEAGYRRDPVIRACAFADAAFLWSELDRIITLDRRDRLCLDAGAGLGLNDGITVPCALMGSCMGSCTFAGMKRPERIGRLIGPVQMIGIFAFQAARRLVLGNRPPAPRLQLQPRHRDCIMLAGCGFSNKQIARALSLTPRTIDGYMTEARNLLDARDRAELVISAIFAGEIGLHEFRPHQAE